MKLGILVNTNRHLGHIVGIAMAATGKGYEVIIFVMDEGTRLLHKDKFVELCTLKGVSASFCSHSAKELGINAADISDYISSSSQLNNAVMNNQADRIIVL